MSILYYTSNGCSIYMETPYVKGKIHGVVKVYNISGKVTSEVPYVNNMVSGDAKYYYDNGKLEYQVEYKNDIFVSGVYIDKNNEKRAVSSEEFMKRKM